MVKIPPSKAGDTGSIKVHAMELGSHMPWNVKQQIAIENLNTSMQKQNSNNWSYSAPNIKINSKNELQTWM